jgi:CheY-like chemotaxis protein
MNISTSVVKTWQVIVVEDMYDDQQVVSRILAHYGAKVHIAPDGNACLDLLKTIDPTVIVTDLAMPHRDGWQTLVAIRSNVATAHIPVVAVTAYHSADVAQDALKAGFDGYIPKPLDPAHFIAQLQQVVG